MTYPKIVSREEWNAARAALLIKEKEATRARDRLNAERRRLPMVRMDKPYTFEGPQGTVSLADMFEGRRQLIIYHFMFDPDWTDGCPSCTNLVNNMPSRVDGILQSNTTLALVSRAPLAKLEDYKARKGWTIPWYSSFGSDFNYDFGVSLPDGEIPGVSVFLRNGEDVLHAYFTTGRGADILLGDYNYLDLTPLGRQEAWEDRPEGSFTPPANA